MKQLFRFWIAAALLIVAGCVEEYDDSALVGRVDDLESRVQRLEQLCQQMNTNISSLQTIVTALQNNDYVTGVTPITENGKTIGYTITFAKAQSITIYHGKDGQNGADGKDGLDGADGKDGYTPIIGVRQDTDGIYYWTLNGEWLLDASGNKIPTTGKDGANGKDGIDGEDGNDGADGSDGAPGADGANGSYGQDGAPGQDGQDGITPQLKIEDGYWYVSYDNGVSWVVVGQATGDQGPQGEQGPQGDQGPQGNPGENGDPMFADIDYSTSNEYVTFVLSNGTQIQIPTWYAFEALKAQCERMNSNIEALQSIVSALEDNDYVTDVIPVVENGKEVGYIIKFSKSGSVTIYHGQDGKDGADGQTPVIGVLQDTDGVYYWTLNGEWLLDASGNKIPTTGKDGADGSDGAPGADGANGSDGQDGAPGQDGQDGITPQLKIEDGYWYVSYDNGVSWVVVGQATGDQGPQGEQGPQGDQGPQGNPGKDGDSFFQSVTQDNEFVYFTLADGTIISLPKRISLAIEFDSDDLVVMQTNSSRDIRYTVTSILPDVEVEVISSADIKAKVISDDSYSGVIRVKTGDTIDEYSKVVVLVSNGEKVIMNTLEFEESAIEVIDEARVIGPAEGGVVELIYLSNMDCEVVIPDDAKDWISLAPATKSLQQRSVNIVLQPNTEYYRSATVTIKAKDGSLSLEYVIEQDGDLGVNIDPTQIPDNEIWYVMSDRTIYDIYLTTKTYGHEPFDAKAISNTYKNGYGIIKFDAPVTKINDHTFDNSRAADMTELYLPDCIEYIGTGAISGTGLTTLHIPKNLKFVDSNGLNNSNLESFSGEHVSEDGRCVIIGDGFMPNYGNTQTPVKNYMAAFAPAGITEYTLPNNVEILGGYTFAWCPELRKITFNEGLKTIMGDCFVNVHLDCDIIFPSTLEDLDSYAFRSCSGIKGFYGNERFHTSDHLCLTFEQTAFSEPEKNGKWISRFVGYDVTDYSIPEGIKGIENYSFDNMPNLKTVSLPSSLKQVGSSAFNHCDNLEALYGECVSDDHKAIVFDTQFSRLVVTKAVVSYNIPDDITSIGYCAFRDCNEIEVITMGDQVTEIGGYAFSHCNNLKTIRLSANIKRILENSNPFLHSDNLEEIYMRAPIPPDYYDEQMSEFPKLKFYVPEQSLALYQNHPGWSQFKEYMVGYHYDDLPEPDYYISSDYSSDGTAITLQTATVGNGIDIVLMGDGYSDRQIADGTYKADMENLYNNLFTEEPYKSFKDHFNVYYVNVVSVTEGYEHGGAALGGYFGNGTLVGGNDNAVFDYALNAISEGEMDEALLIVAMNSDNYAGTCYMYYPETNADYGNGVSVSYFPKGGDATTFAQLLHHEACGHGFAKLADEYAYEGMGAVPSDYVSEIQSQQANWGWWKNVDFTSDPTATRWSHFVNDTRYANERLGAYEGGLTYWTGVWRPTENSIMRYNTGGFNAPSREAIYYRIHKLAYGDSWEYDYEDFVEWDARNRTTAATRAMVYRPADYKPTHAPVVVNKSWKDAK